jgi:hypothetical protein
VRGRVWAGTSALGCDFLDQLLHVHFVDALLPNDLWTLCEGSVSTPHREPSWCGDARVRVRLCVCVCVCCGCACVCSCRWCCALVCEGGDEGVDVGSTSAVALHLISPSALDQLCAQHFLQPASHPGKSVRWQRGPREDTADELNHSAEKTSRESTYFSFSPDSINF